MIFDIQNFTNLLKDIQIFSKSHLWLYFLYLLCFLLLKSIFCVQRIYVFGKFSVLIATLEYICTKYLFENCFATNFYIVNDIFQFYGNLLIPLWKQFLCAWNLGLKVSFLQSILPFSLQFKIYSILCKYIKCIEYHKEYII